MHTNMTFYLIILNIHRKQDLTQKLMFSNKYWFTICSNPFCCIYSLYLVLFSFSQLSNSIAFVLTMIMLDWEMFYFCSITFGDEQSICNVFSIFRTLKLISSVLHWSFIIFSTKACKQNHYTINSRCTMTYHYWYHSFRSLFISFTFTYV